MDAGAPEPALLRDQPRLPTEFSHLVAVAGRFPPPIDWAAFEAFARLTRRAYARWELDVLQHIDSQRQAWPRLPRR